MSQPASSTTSVRHYRIDWLLVAVTVVAVLLLVATSIRIPVSQDPEARSLGGLNVLSDDERLVLFEDFSASANGWTPADRTRHSVSAGTALGPFATETVRRIVTVPPGTLRVETSFTLHLTDDWPTGAILHLSDGASTAQSALDGATGTADDGAAVALTLRPVEGPLPAYAVRWITRPTEAEMPLSIRIAGANVQGWSIDNVQIVAQLAELPVP